MNLTDILEEAQKNGKIPSVIAYNRIDWGGSSLDLREWQMSLRGSDFDLNDISNHLHKLNSDPAMYWSRNLPRTVGITIDIGTLIEAYPLDKGKIGIESADYPEYNCIEEKGMITPVELIKEKSGEIKEKNKWLLKIIESMGIDGVLFKLQNQRPELKSAGLGGSATVTTGATILANELAGKIFNAYQIIERSSIFEQDYGVSITGTQEQSNVVFGGVTDYLWSWFFPGENNFYGTSVRTLLLKEKDCRELEDRIALYFVGERSSTDVNAIWREKLLKDRQGFILHSKKLLLAYQLREAIRTKNWEAAKDPILQYQKIRTELCSAYMNSCQKIEDICKKYDSVSFPLGAGGGGSVMIYSPNPKNLKNIQKELENYHRIDFKILPKGHRLKNIEFFNEIKKRK